MITTRPVTEPLNRSRRHPRGGRADRASAPRVPIAAAGVLALVLAGAGAASAIPSASPIAVGGDRVVSVALASPLPADTDSGGSDDSGDSGAGYGPSGPPISAPCGDPSCSHGSSSSSSGSGGGGGSASVRVGGGSDSGSEDDPGSGGIFGFIKKALNGASDAAGSAASSGAQGGGEGSAEGDGAGLASKIVSSVFDGVKSALSRLGSGGN